MIATQPISTPRWRQFTTTLAAIVGLSALTFYAFRPVTQNGFVNWGDRADLVDNQQFRGFRPENLFWMFTTIQMGHYQPLSWLTFAADHAVHGMDAGGYHTTSLCLHIATVIAVFFLLRTLLRLALGPDRSLTMALAAFIGTALFAVHPLRVETVAWATERRGSLSGLFYVIAVCFYLRYADPTPSSSLNAASRNRAYWLAVAAFLLSLLAKEFAVSLPVVLLILDCYPLRRLDWTAGNLVRREVWPVWREKTPFVLIALVGAGIAALSSAQSGVAMSMADFGPAKRIAQSCYGLIFYLMKSALPTELSPLYAIPTHMSAFEPRYLLCAGLVVGLTITLVLFRRAMPAGLAAWASYVVILLPVLGLVQTGRQMAADRYTYLPAIVISAVVAAIFASILRPGRSSVWLTFRCISCVGAVGLLLVPLIRLSREQSAAWKDSTTLWRQALKADPQNAVAHSNLGEALAAERQFVDACEQFRLAVSIDPTFADAYSNFGVALAEQGRMTEAVEQWRAALRADPRHAAAASNLQRAEELQRVR